jgi:hypothetical protein
MTALGHERRTRPGRGSGACPLRSESDQLAARQRNDAMCQKATFALQQTASLFDQLVGEAAQLGS